MTALPLVGVLALQGDVVEHVRHLEACGVEATKVRKVADLEGLDGIVLPGGESTTISRLLGLSGLFEPLAERLRAGLPVYGSCAGMILLASEVLDTREDARSFGAIDMTVRRNAFGRQVDSFETALELEGVSGPPVHAVFIRAPWVERVGDGVEVLARVRAGDDRDHVVAVRQGSAIATSFHPEVTGDLRVHEYFCAMVRAAQGQGCSP